MFKGESMGDKGKVYHATGLNTDEALRLLEGELSQPIEFAVSQVLDFYARKLGFVANVVIDEALKTVDFLMPVDMYYRDFGMCLFAAEGMNIDGLGSLKLEFTINPARLRPEFPAIINTLSTQAAIMGVGSKVSIKEDGTLKISFYADSEGFYDVATKWYAENRDSSVNFEN